MKRLAPWQVAVAVWVLVVLMLTLCRENEAERCEREGSQWIEHNGVVGCVRRIP